MTATLSVNEAKTNFSSVLADVQSNRQIVTILRYGHPIAQIVPILRHNRTKTDSLLSKIVVKGDMLADEADDWEEG